MCDSITLLSLFVRIQSCQVFDLGYGQTFNSRIAKIYHGKKILYFYTFFKNILLSDITPRLCLLNILKVNTYKYITHT